YEAKSPVLQKPFSVPELLKTALRVYVALKETDKAQAVMGELEKEVGKESGDSAKAQLTQIYIAMARSMKDQMETLREQGKAEELAKLTKGFEVVLDRISSQEQGNSFESLYWVSDSFYNMAVNGDTGAQSEDEKTLKEGKFPAPPTEAAQYYAK